MHRSRLAPLSFLLLLAGPLAACGAGDPAGVRAGTGTAAPAATPEPTAAPGPTPAPGPGPDPGGSGTVAVRLEEVGGVFIEGFEVALRFEDGDGATIASTYWTDFVTGQEGDAATDFYGSVLEQPVPAGTVTVRAETAVGIGPPPVQPDLDGDLRCALTVDVAAGARIELEVGFGDGDCLRVAGR